VSVFGGLGAAIRLRQAGITDFVVLERAAALGRTWRDNSYPGCACGVPSHRLRAEVTRAQWDPATTRWRVDTTLGSLTATVVITAAGPLSEPSVPDIPGLDRGSATPPSST
jgi:cation diffusion facilitator CzcD-associated flavoprotein CzcO